MTPASPYPSPVELERLADLTARYARYSRSAGGLSSVVGGVLCALTFVVGAFLPLDQGWRYALASAPLLWIASKEALRCFYYQRSGAAVERLSARHQRVHRWMTIYLALLSTLIIVAVFVAAYQKHRFALLFGWPGVGYPILVAALPLVAWRWFWSVSDFLVGVLMFTQAAIVIAGGRYPAPPTVVVASFAFIAIASGLREHREYLLLRRELGLDGTAN